MRTGSKGQTPKEEEDFIKAQNLRANCLSYQDETHEKASVVVHYDIRESWQPAMF